MIREKNFQLTGAENRPILLDTYYKPDHSPKPIVIFMHGYKGFKDWGAWDLAAEKFADAGYFFIKFNFSHNGGTPQQPIDFPDLEAFARDNYSKQLYDLECVIDWICTTKQFISEADVKELSLIGHSRGGGIACLGASRNKAVKKLITWAGVSDFGSRFPSGEKLKEWKEKGVFYVKNGRTQQQMPHYIQFYEDFQTHRKKLDIEGAVRKLTQPFLIIHAKEDPSVSVEEAHKLKAYAQNPQLELLENTDHVFNTKHPWEQESLSPELDLVCEKSIEFLT